MNIQQLTYIVEIANRKSISRAAEYLFVSQPALSQQIRNLEKELGYRVFYRTSKGLDAYAAIKDGSLDMALDRMPENEIGMEKCVCFAKVKNISQADDENRRNLFFSFCSKFH